MSMKTPSKQAQIAVEKAVTLNEQVIKLVKQRNKARERAVKLLMAEEFSLREIGELMRISGQRVGALVQYWRRLFPKS